jgi:hypothetical protein
MDFYSIRCLKPLIRKKAVLKSKQVNAVLIFQYSIEQQQKVVAYINFYVRQTQLLEVKLR